MSKSRSGKLAKRESMNLANSSFIRTCEENEVKKISWNLTRLLHVWESGGQYQSSISRGLWQRFHLEASLLEGGDNISMTLGGDGDGSISGFVACWWQGSSGSWGLRSVSQRDPHRYNFQSLWLISKLGCSVSSRKTPLFPRKNSLQTLATILTGFLLTAWFCNLKKI